MIASCDGSRNLESILKWWDAKAYPYIYWFVNNILLTWQPLDLLEAWENNPAIDLIPQSVRGKVVKFIKMCRKNEGVQRNYDCWAFVREILWVESFSSFVEIPEWELCMGDAAYFNQFPEKDMDWVPFWGWVWHYAIYIWNWLYLSKFRSNWGVIICNSKQIMKEFPYKYLWRAQF